MKRDAFSCCHPAVNFLFFVGAFCMMIAHPAYVAAGMAQSATGCCWARAREESWC